MFLLVSDTNHVELLILIYVLLGTAEILKLKLVVRRRKQAAVTRQTESKMRKQQRYLLVGNGHCALES